MNNKLGVIGSFIKGIVSHTNNDKFCIFILFIAVGSFIYVHKQVRAEIVKLKGLNKKENDIKNKIILTPKMDEMINKSIVQEQWIKYQNDLKSCQLSKPNIRNYFNKTIIIDIPGKRKVADIIPGILTALGILGTFLGLFNGIGELFGGANNFNTVDLSDNIGHLLGGMSLAFVTSIVGISSSIVWSAVDRFIYKKYIEELNEFIHKGIEKDKSLNTNDLLEKLINIQTDQKESIKHIGTTVATEVGRVLDMSIKDQLIPNLNKSISQTIVPAIEGMTNSFTDFSTVATNSQTEGIGKVVDKFLETMNSALQGQFENLAGTIEDLCKWQIETKESLDSLISELKETTVNQKEINASSEEMVRSFVEYFTKLEAASDDLNENIKEISGVTITFNEMIQYSKRLASEIDDKERNLENRTREYLENIDSSITSMKNHWDTTNSHLMDVNNSLENSAKEFSVNLKDGLNRTFEDFDSNLASISNRLSGTISEVQQTIEELPSIVQELSNSLNATLDKVPHVNEETLIKNVTV